jgi:predicted transcriptional regulator
MATRTSENFLPKLTAEIVSAYIANNPLTLSELSGLIANVRTSLERLDSDPDGVIIFHVPAVPIHKSLQSDCLICLEDGKRFKSLRRHLATQHKMSPDQYRQKWQLPNTYPMVAPGFSDKRSMLAKKYGLGRSRAKSRR